MGLIGLSGLSELRMRLRLSQSEVPGAMNKSGLRLSAKYEVPRVMNKSGLRLSAKYEVPRVMSDSGLRLRLRLMVPGIAFIKPNQSNITPRPFLLQIAITKTRIFAKTRWL
jgi:hypothetical protein